MNREDASITLKRRACRDFSEKPLEKEEVAALINDAAWVPSESNQQSWRVVAITDLARLRACSDALPLSPHLQSYAATLSDPEANIFYYASAVVVIYGNSESYWSIYDCSMVAGTLHFLAEERGLGCRWIGAVQQIFANPGVMAEWGVPANYRPVASLVLGYSPQPRQVVDPSTQGIPSWSPSSNGVSP